MKSIFTAGQKALVALMTIAALLAGGSAYAQNTVKGSVVDVNGEPVIGAGVVVVGTNNGAVTDLNGQFELSVKAGAKLEVSCVGYSTQQVNASNGVKVILEEDTTYLDDAVVIGYGSVRVKDLTGSVTSVTGKDLEIPVANVAQALRGKMAGVVVSGNDSAPGSSPSIRVRGNKSISASNEPLVLVDGFPGSLSTIPADQIKSINVLKDAAATAIYGSRGAAGVILVTTKNAVEGQTSVSYNGYIQIKDSSTQIYDVMDASDYLKFTLGYAKDYNATNYDGMLQFFGMGQYGDNYQKYVNQGIHNWQKDLLKTGISHTHNLTISNGTKKNKTQFTLNYMHDDGTVINSYYDRINAGLKTSEVLTDNLNVDFNLTYNTSKSRGGANQAGGYRYRPLEPYGDATNLSGFGNGSGNYDLVYDPIGGTYDSEPSSNNHNFRGIASINWRPVTGLTLRTELSLAKSFSNSESYTKGEYNNSKKSAGVSRGESGSLVWNTTAQYQIPFKNKNHRADIMVGNEMRTSNGSSMSFSAYEYPKNFNRAQTLAFITEFSEKYTFSNSYNTPGRAVSYFGRANYTLKDRYLFTATVRADGSANFAPNNRWGIFPAGAFAWRIIEEPWMQSTRSWMDDLKIRFSYGISGSDSIGTGHWRETWSLGGETTTTISSQRSDTELDYLKTYAPGSRMMNPNLKWEETTTMNAGVDFSFFKNRLSGTIEGYLIRTDGLLQSTPVNPASGYGSQYQNFGVISNRGFELTLNGDIVDTKDFSLRAGIVFQYNRNNVDDVYETVTVTKYGSWSNSERFPQGGEYYLEVGKPMGLIKAYKYEGWYTTDDFNYDPATQVWTLKEGIPDYAVDSYWTSFKLPAGQRAFPGALKVADLYPANKPDGKITTDDTYNIGEIVPRSSGSLNLSARWKGFDLTANFNYVLGGRIVNQAFLSNMYGAKDNNFGANRLAFVGKAYSPYRWNNGQLEFVNDPAELNKMNANATMYTPTSMVGLLLDKWIENATYFRLNNLTIGYTVPRSVASKIGMKNLRAYLTATNLFTLTGYSGLNPAVSTASSTTPCVDGGGYPLSRTYTLGLNITF